MIGSLREVAKDDANEHAGSPYDRLAAADGWVANDAVVVVHSLSLPAGHRRCRAALLSPYDNARRRTLFRRAWEREGRLGVAPQQAEVHEPR